MASTARQVGKQDMRAVHEMVLVNPHLQGCSLDCGCAEADGCVCTLRQSKGERRAGEWRGWRGRQVLGDPTHLHPQKQQHAL